MNPPSGATCSARILWSVLGTDSVRMDWLGEVSRTEGLVLGESGAEVGQELRFELLDHAGARLAAGLARVVDATPGEAMRIEFLALGIDPAVLDALVASGPTSSKRRPPPLPTAESRAAPPPLPATTAASAAADDDDDEVMAQIEQLSVRREGIIIGIDLGTTNTCASYVVDGRPRVIPGRTGTNFIPSMITFEPGGAFHVGQRAADRQVLHPLRTVYGSKRLIGRTWRADLAAEMQRHFAYPLAEADGQRFGVRIDGRVVSMDTIAARVLDEVRTSAESHLGVPVDAAVITVPAYFTEVQREAVRRAAREANLVVHRIVTEPTAAAVAYGHKQAASARIAVWDLGGGTFDFSIVDVDRGELTVVATGGDNFLGGADFDDLAASWVLGEFQRIHRIDLEPDAQQIARLREAVDGAKMLLSSQTEAMIELVEFTRQPRRDLAVEITRERFDELTHSLVERTVELAREVMQSASIDPAEVDDVVLVGGSTRMPAVEHAVERLFGKRPSKRINPDEAVALGAALLADELRNPGGPTLVDILPMSVGRGRPGGRFEPIVPRYTRLPVEREIVAEADLLGSVSVPIFQGDSPDVRRDEYLCTAIVEDRSLWDRGRVALRLSFDEHCVMAVDAKDARTGRPIPVKLDRARSLDDVLRELGASASPPEEPTWRLPESRLGRIFGKLSSLFGR